MFLGKNHIILVTFIKLTLKADILKAALKHKDAGEKTTRHNPAL